MTKGHVNVAFIVIPLSVFGFHPQLFLFIDMRQCPGIVIAR